MSSKATSIGLSALGSYVVPSNVNVRSLYEISSPTTQCENILGKFKNGTVCYICGLPIIQQKTKGVDGRNPECEHILPIAQAVIFLNLYSAKVKTNTLLYRPDVLHLEYGWSHRTCNQVKSDNSYIDYIASKSVGSKFLVEQKGLKKLLQQIWRNTRKDSTGFNSELKQVYGHSEKTFIDTRLPVIVNRFQMITDFLNSYDSPEMVVLIGAAKALEGPMSEEGAKLVGSVSIEAKTIEKIRELKAQVETLYDTILESVINDYKRLIHISNKFIEYAKSFKPFYTSFYVKLNDVNRPYWQDYVKVKLETILYLMEVDEPAAAKILLSLGKNVEPKFEPIKRQLSNLAKKIATDAGQCWYITLQAEEDRLTDTYSPNNFESAAVAALSSGLFKFNCPIVKHISLKKKKNVSVKKESIKAKSASIKAKSASQTSIESRKRREEKSRNLRKKQRSAQFTAKRRPITSLNENKLSTILEENENVFINNNNVNMTKSGGRRKTRKNRRH